LLDLARHWGIGGNKIQEAHQQYLRQLARSALADGVITETERRDLRQVAFLLGIYGSELDEILKMASRTLSREPMVDKSTLEPLRREQLTGNRVCFTGECQCRHLGQIITRKMATELATNQGVIVVESVTKNLPLLVVADPLSQSGKAKKARKYGILIMHEVVFWKVLGIEVE
jgi:DNA polymerase-3 subunit epsilon